MFIFRRLLLPVALFLFCLPGRSQLVVDATVNEIQAVQNILLGGGVTVSNITFSGDANQIGSFDATQTILGIQEGVIMATGDIAGAIGPNNQSGMTQGGGNFGANDPDLDIIAGIGTNDAAILEFDFVPSGDSIEFNYTFGSEEYLEYVGSINDAFGFFLSGPGIAGPYQNNAINIAQVPGGGGNVTINNVNTTSNPSYYIDNGDGSTAPYNTGNQYLQYDGYTVVMTAAAQVQCGQTYHIKICIADAADDILDSGVFLEANSFYSDAIQVDVTTVTGDSTIIEGCSPALFSFTRPDTSGQYTVHYDMGGSATNGQDFLQIPDSVTFQPGDDSVSVVILPIVDTITEGIDTLTITVYTVNSCGDTIISEGSVYIVDLPDVQTFTTDTTLVCQVDSLLITASATGGEPPMTYSWNTGQTGDSIWVVPTNGTNYYEVVATESCQGASDTDTVVVQANFVPLVVTASLDTTVLCPGDPATLTAQGSGGVAPYTYSWSSGGNSSTEIVNPMVTTEYIVSIQDSCGQAIVTDTVVVTVPEDSLSIDLPDVSVTCAGDTVNLVPSVTGGSQPYSYSWDTGSTNDTLTVNPLTTQSYTLTAQDMCGRTEDTTVTVTVPVYDPIDISITLPTPPNCVGSQIGIPASASGGAGGYQYVWDVEGQTFMSNPLGFTPNESGVFAVSVVVTDQCGNIGQNDTIVEAVACTITVPNVFTPNGDGINETFFVENIGFWEYSHVQIFNRWGQMLYEASPYQNNWSGDKHPDGTYYYIVTVRNGEEEIIEKGSLTKISD